MDEVGSALIATTLVLDRRVRADDHPSISGFKFYQTVRV